MQSQNTSSLVLHTGVCQPVSLRTQSYQGEGAWVPGPTEPVTSAKSVHLGCETYFEDTLVKLPCLLTLETLLRNNTSHCTEKPRHRWLHLGKSPRSKEDLAQPKICIHKQNCILLNPLFGLPVDQCLNLDVTDSLGERMLCLRAVLCTEATSLGLHLKHPSPKV